MADILRCTDWRGRVVALSEQRWREAVLPFRPDLTDRLDQVVAAIERSEFVTRADDDPQWQYYYLRRGVEARPDLYLRVEVVFRRRRGLRSVIGAITDAAFVNGKQPREKLVWTRTL